MKMKNVITAVAFAAFATTASAGSMTKPAEEKQPDFDPMPAASSSAGSLGGGMAPAIIGLVAVGIAVAASDGS